MSYYLFDPKRIVAFDPLVSLLQMWATNLNASIRFDRVGGVDRQGLNLQAEFRF